MKRILIAAITAMVISSTAFATDENKVSLNIKETFKEEFKEARRVEWTVKSDFVKAAFEENGARINVFYDPQGNKIGKSHTIALEDLPLSARRSIAKKYAEHNITEAVEFSGIEGDAFYITAENDNEKVILKITDTSSISTFKKTRKDKMW